MADNVTTQSATPATLPTNTIIATDDVGGVHYQQVKINVGGDGIDLPLVAGEKAAASSLPVVLATENSSDLTVAGPAAQSALNALLIPQTDVSKYRFVSVQINSSATTGTYIFEVSNDGGSIWVPVALQDASAASSALAQYTATAANRIFHGAVTGALFRVRISTLLTGGTIQAFANFAQTSGPMGIQGVMSAATLTVAGNAAHNVAASSNLNQVGFESRTTARTATGDAVSSRPIVDKLGRTVVIDGQIRELNDTNTLVISTTTETTLIAAVAAVTHDIKDLIVSNTSAVDVRVDFRDSVAGTVRLSIFVKAGTTVPIVGMRRLKQAAVNTSWTAQLSAAVTDVRITSLSDRTS